MENTLNLALSGGIVLVAAVVAVGLWKRQEIMRLLAVNSLFSAKKIVKNFSSMEQAFLTLPLTRGDGPVFDLPKGAQITLPDGGAKWLVDRQITALVVLNDGQMVFEDYYLGTTAQDRRISWSVAKSFLSALFGILHEEGTFDSLNDPVTKYAPELGNSAYAKASLRNVLQMSSGVEFDEDYLAFKSDINRMGRVLALGGSMDKFSQTLTGVFDEPGKTWQYVSIDTHVLGMVIRGATGRNVTDLLQEKVLHPMGLECDPYYISDGFGVAFVLGGLNLRTRDYARFGQMFLQQGQYNGQQIVPADWVAASTKASANTAPGETRYGYQWWVPGDAEPGEYFARGIYGQYIYINERLNAVIASNAADLHFREDGIDRQDIDMFRQIANSA